MFVFLWLCFCHLTSVNALAPQQVFFLITTITWRRKKLPTFRHILPPCLNRELCLASPGPACVMPRRSFFSVIMNVSGGEEAKNWLPQIGRRLPCYLVFVKVLHSSTMLSGLCKSISSSMLSGLSLICIWCYHDMGSSYPACNYYALQLKKRCF